MEGERYLERKRKERAFERFELIETKFISLIFAQNKLVQNLITYSSCVLMCAAHVVQQHCQYLYGDKRLKLHRPTYLNIIAQPY